jgi:hypothetical protein
VLDRLDIHHKRGRTYVHSPDPAYEEKLARIEDLKRFVQVHPDEYVLLYQDESSIYRQPSVGYTYEAADSDCPHARQARLLNNLIRLVGTKQMASFYQLARQAYPDAKRIWLIQDNWPPHFHPDVLLALEEQERLPTYARLLQSD